MVTIFLDFLDYLPREVCRELKERSNSLARLAWKIILIVALIIPEHLFPILTKFTRLKKKNFILKDCYGKTEVIQFTVHRSIIIWIVLVIQFLKKTSKEIFLLINY